MHTNLWRWYYISAYGLMWLAWKRIWNRDDPAGRDERLQGTHAAASMETIKAQRLMTSIILWHLICVRDGAINMKCHTTTYLMRYQATRGRQTGTTWHLSKKMSYSWLLRRQSAPSLSLQLRAFRGSAFPTPAQIKLHHCRPAAGDSAHNTKTIRTDWRVNRPARAHWPESATEMCIFGLAGLKPDLKHRRIRTMETAGGTEMKKSIWFTLITHRNHRATGTRGGTGGEGNLWLVKSAVPMPQNREELHLYCIVCTSLWSEDSSANKGKAKEGRLAPS